MADAVTMRAMKTDGTNMEREGLLEVARLMCVAARTAQVKAVLRALPSG